MIAGALLALVALLRLVNFFQFVRYHFNFPALVGMAAFAFAAAMLLTNRRDNLLLIALSVLAVNQLIWSSEVDFVAAVLLLVVALVMTTEYLPQAKALAEKIWFVPAILSVIGGLIGIFGGMRYGYITFLSVVWFLVEAAAMLLCGFWLAFPERDISELFAAAKELGEQTGVRSKLAAPGLILSLVAGFVPVILMQAKINEIITFENTEVVAPVEAVAEEVAKEKEEN